MYDVEFQVATLWAGRGPCFRCLHPEPPPWWQRRFPVFGAVAAVAGALAAGVIGVLRQEIDDLEIAPDPADFHLAFDRDVLITEEDHLPLQQELAQVGDHLVGQRLAQVHAVNLRADHWRQMVE